MLKNDWLVGINGPRRVLCWDSWQWMWGWRWCAWSQDRWWCQCLNHPLQNQRLQHSKKEHHSASLGLPCRLACSFDPCGSRVVRSLNLVVCLHTNTTWTKHCYRYPYLEQTTSRLGDPCSSTFITNWGLRRHVVSVLLHENTNLLIVVVTCRASC